MLFCCAVCYAGSIRLTGGQSAAEGTVDFCDENIWAAICDVYWSANDAEVVCRQLGFNASELNTCRLQFCTSKYATGVAVYNSFYGEGTSYYFWENVAGGCVGTEQTLLSCPPSPFLTLSCSGNQFAGVQCSVPCKLLVHRVGTKCMLIYIVPVTILSSMQFIIAYLPVINTQFHIVTLCTLLLHEGSTQSCM